MDVVKLNAYHEWREHTDGRWYLFYDGGNIRPSSPDEQELINACRARWSTPATDPAVLTSYPFPYHD